MSMRDDLIGKRGTLAVSTDTGGLVRYGGNLATSYSAYAHLGDYQAWDSPHRDMTTTRRVDLTRVVKFGMFGTWPFALDEVPLNGFYAAPDLTELPGQKLPLIVIAHGFIQHGSPSLINSTRGFIPYVQHLASHGFIATTIDCNFLNGGGANTDMDARALMMLEHVKQFEEWNKDATHPLHNRVDLSKVILAGHSRGGRAAAIASVFCGLTSYVSDDTEPGDPAVIIKIDGTGPETFGPYDKTHFTVTGVIGLAPTDARFEVPVTWADEVVTTNYMVVHGSHDSDVRLFSGQRTYDRALPIDLTNPVKDAPGLKGLAFLRGGAHNYFNVVWDLEPSADARDWRPYLVSSGAQQEAAVACMTGFIYGVTRGELKNLPFHPPYAGTSGLAVDLVTQYQGARRFFLQHSEETHPRWPKPVIAKPAVGFVGVSILDFPNFMVDYFADGDHERHLRFQDTYGVTLGMDGKTATGTWLPYVLVVTGIRNPMGTVDPFDFSKWKYLQFRAGWGPLPSGFNSEFKIELNDTASATKVALSSTAFAPVASTLHSRPDGTRRLVMQTMRIPLKAFADLGIKLKDTTTITLLLRNNTAGQASLYVDDIQVTNEDLG
jgi:hypothetical protein